MLSHVTVCSVSVVLHYGMIGECCLVLKRAQQVHSCVMACTASAMLRYGVLGECSLVLRRAW